jgi:hypothetical protein
VYKYPPSPSTLLEHTYDFSLQPNRGFQIEKEQFSGLSIVATH